MRYMKRRKPARGRGKYKRRRMYSKRKRGSSTVAIAKRVVRAAVNRSMEKKVNSFQLSYATTRLKVNYLIGSFFLPGSQSWQRIGNKAILSGIGVKGIVRHTLLGSDDGTTQDGPITVRFMIVSTKRTDSPLAYFYKNEDVDEPLNADTGSNDATGDILRSTYKLNTRDYRIHKMWSRKVMPAAIGQLNNNRTAEFNVYTRINKEMHWNVPANDVTYPLPATQVRPNFWVILYSYMPDTTIIPSRDPTFSTNFTIREYYRE